MIRDGVHFNELGADHLDLRHKERTQRYLVNRLEGLGYKVTLEPDALR